MAVLHDALKSLAPVFFADIPQDETELRDWLTDLFSQSQVILDSIPIAEPTKEQSSTSIPHPTVPASNASEVVTSAARPPHPPPEHYALQKEWGKAMKLGAKENPRGMSVYKLGGKDGRGAWFARHSVHEGIPFTQFKRALEMEFPESLAVHGAPGEGNIRGIGGETRVENLKVDSAGRVEVYRLSAQFPGPTTPRDFVTLLVTSENAIAPASTGDSVPRHYMIISKPCDHPETQPQNGFIRGYYESVEFIREVARPLQGSQSTTSLPERGGRIDELRSGTTSGKPQQETTASSLSVDTVVKNNKAGALTEQEEMNPVEWIMVTRSDPGGSVPRFMVERGTPSSICADADKFLDWACQHHFNDKEVADAKDSVPLTNPMTQESLRSFRNSRTVGVHGEQDDSHSDDGTERVIEEHDSGPDQTRGSGLLAGAAQYISSYTPQVVLDHLPGSHVTSPEHSQDKLVVPEQDDDIVSTTSFASADSHLLSESEHDASPSSLKDSTPRKSDEQLNHHERELRKLEQRRAALEKKFSESRARLEQDATAQTAKEEIAQQKAAERHEKDLKKQHAKYEKEMQRIEARQKKEKQKLEAKKRKKVDKDEKARLTRERDAARQELDIVKKEVETLNNIVEDLQRENTRLVAKLGKIDLAGELAKDNSQPPSRHGSHKKAKSRSGTASTATSVKSQ